MNQDELNIVIQEVARVALEDARIKDYIGNELDLSDEELNKVLDYLEHLWQEDMKLLKGEANGNR